MRPQQPSSLGWRDYYQIATSLLMLPLGATLLYRSALRAPMAVLVGAGFLGLGLYRLAWIRRYFRERRGEKL